MGGLDLTGARQVLNDLLFDGSGVLVTDENGVVDDQLDPATGKLTQVGDAQMYTGEGLVLPVSSFGAGRVPDLGIALTPTDSMSTHRLLLPLTAPDGIRVGALVKVTAVNPLLGDVQIVGRHFEVTEIPTTSMVSVVRVSFLKPVRSPAVRADDPEGE